MEKNNEDKRSIWMKILEGIGCVLLTILVIVGFAAFSAGVALGTSWIVMTLLNFIIVHFGFAAFTFWEVAKTYGLVKFIIYMIASICVIKDMFD